MKYSIEYKASALRAFRKLPRQAQQQIAPVIDALAENPRPSGVVKLTNAETFACGRAIIESSTPLKMRRYLCLSSK